MPLFSQRSFNPWSQHTYNPVRLTSCTIRASLFHRAFAQPSSTDWYCSTISSTYDLAPSYCDATAPPYDALFGGVRSSSHPPRPSFRWVMSLKFESVLSLTSLLTAVYATPTDDGVVLAPTPMGPSPQKEWLWPSPSPSPSPSE